MLKKKFKNNFIFTQKLNKYLFFEYLLKKNKVLKKKPHPHVMSSLPTPNPNQTISPTLPLYPDKGISKQWNVLLSERSNP